MQLRKAGRAMTPDPHFDHDSTEGSLERRTERHLCTVCIMYKALFHLKLVYTFQIVRTNMKKPDVYRLPEYDATLRSEEACKVKCLRLDINPKPYHKRSIFWPCSARYGKTPEDGSLFSFYRSKRRRTLSQTTPTLHGILYLTRLSQASEPRTWLARRKAIYLSGVYAVWAFYWPVAQAAEVARSKLCLFCFFISSPLEPFVEICGCS